MSANTFLIFNLILLGVILESDLGRRKIGVFRVARPLVGAAIIAPFFVAAPGGSAWSSSLELASIVLGLGLGLAAAVLMPVTWDSARHRAYSRAGLAYAMLWVTLSAARYVFSYGARHWFGHPLNAFMTTNHVSRGVLADALIFLFLTMYLVRTVSLIVRRYTVRGQAQAG